MRKDEKNICQIYSQETVVHYKEKRKNAFFNKNLVNPTFRKIILSQEEIQNKHILDIGCGFGADLEYLSKHGALHLTGAEINPYFLDELKKNLALSKIKTYQQSIYHLHLPKKYDLALSNMVLDQVEDLNRAFAQVARTLKRKGLLIFSVMHPLNIATTDYKKPLVNYFAKETKTIHPKSLDQDLFIYQRTIADFSSALSQNGFTIQSIHEPRPIENKSKKLQSKSHYYNFPGTLIICAQLIN